MRDAETSPADIRTVLRDAAPDLTRRIDVLAGRWLSKLTALLDSKVQLTFRPKQINDPVWGTIELYPWEVALIDTGLLQRLRGVRQLGLAQLVFPSASHDRFEHIIGVIGAVETTLRALSRQVERWNSENPKRVLPVIEDEDRHALRLSALFHDLGHGPFSHALEPVLETTAVLRAAGAVGLAADWRTDLGSLKSALLEAYSFDEEPQSSELIAAMIVLSDPVAAVFGNRRFPLPGAVDPTALQVRIAAAIVGAVDGPGAHHLGAVISGQIDADKLDYLQRDAHHAGLEIGFDISRLMSRLELLRVRAENIDTTMKDVRERLVHAPDHTLFQVGIAASGFGSFEQMLIGRTFLYDRLYHHHKVRAAEAMAQRLILVAERDRADRFELEDLFVDVGDEVVLRVFAGDVAHPEVADIPQSARDLARGLLDRELLHRAFALRGRFIGVGPDLNPEHVEQKQQKLWTRVVRDLRTLKMRYDLGAEIHALAVRCAAVLKAANIDREVMTTIHDRLLAVGPDQILVDLPSLKAKAITILARYPNGALRVPEFSFNPIKWSNAYELQKRTTYVFCPRDVVPLVSLAAKIVFFGRYGVVLSREADGFIKASEAVRPDWLDALVTAGVLDAEAKANLTVKRLSLVSVEAVDLRVPQSWLALDEDFGHNLARQVNASLAGGLAAEHLSALGEVLVAMWNLVDHWHGSGLATSEIPDEAALQAIVRAKLDMGGLKVTEGTTAGGGALDLYLNGSVILENKIADTVANPATAKAAAGMQGRRYAIALDSQIVLVVLAYRCKPGEMLSKTESVTVHPITRGGDDRVEIRFALPYGSPVPSREKAAV